MKQLRELLPGAMVIKHHDSSRIGLPDCSVTYGKYPSAWIEFKLIKMTQRLLDPATWPELCLKTARDSPTQFMMMMKASTHGTGFYVMWLPKTAVLIWNPLTGQVTQYSNTHLAVLGAGDLITRR